MADLDDINFTYSLTDRVFRLSLGELADFSGAKYDGDFSLTLEQAQQRKHEYVAEQIGIEPNRRVLDLGCGWGPLLNFIRARGAVGLGVTLSWAQEAACRRHGVPASEQAPVRGGWRPRTRVRLRNRALGWHLRASEDKQERPTPHA